MNSVCLTGRFGRDPELRHTGSDGGGKAVTNFGLAVAGRSKDEVTWVEVTAWEGLAESICTYMKKGSEVAVTGRLQVREYEKDGQTRKATEVVAIQVDFIGPKAGGEDAPAVRPAPAPAPVDDDLDPFSDDDGSDPFGDF